MSYYYPTHPPYSPSAPVRPGPNYAKTIALVAVTLLTAVASVVLVIEIQLHNSSSSTHDASDEVATSAAVTAVCQSGSYSYVHGRDAPNFIGATDIAHCTGKLPWTTESPVIAGEEYGPIWIVQFRSLDPALREAQREGLAGATAIVPLGSDLRSVLFFAPADWSGMSLRPLAQLEFPITPAQRVICRSGGQVVTGFSLADILFGVRALPTTSATTRDDLLSRCP